MRLREQWIRPLDALPLDYQHVIAITSSGQEEEMYLVDDKWHIVDGVRIPIEFVVFWHEKREQPTVEMAEDCISREAVYRQINKWVASGDSVLSLHKRVDALPSVQPQSKTLSDAEINAFVDSMKNMRKATKEESKSTVEYIDSISKPTGFLFDEAYEELVRETGITAKEGMGIAKAFHNGLMEGFAEMEQQRRGDAFVEPHKKLSTNLQPCEDCISREQAVYVASGYCAPQNIADELRKLPSVTPQPKRGKWICHRDHCENLGVIPSGLGVYEWCSNCDCGIDVKEFHRNYYNFCPKCGADMRDI